MHSRSAVTWLILVKPKECGRERILAERYLLSTLMMKVNEERNGQKIRYCVFVKLHGVPNLSKGVCCNCTVHSDAHAKS